MSLFDTFKLKRGILTLVTAAAAVIVLGLAGCNSGGSNDVVTPPAETAGWVQQGASFVGRAACRTCHATTDDAYSTQAHGQDFHTAHGRDTITGMGGRCAPCHTTGYGEPTGYNATTELNTALEGIGCEECHGPGSKHIAATTNEERRAQITRVPLVEYTCEDCHVASYKEFDADVPPITDETLAVKAPTASGISGILHRAPLIWGRKLYNSADKPGPHTNIDNNCVACHLQWQAGANGRMEHGEEMLKPDLDTMGTRQPCASCHSGRAEGLVQAGTKELMIKLNGADATGVPNASDLGGMFKAFKDAHPDTIKDDNSTAALDDTKKFKVALYDYFYVLEDKSYGVHNPALARELLETAESILSE